MRKLFFGLFLPLCILFVSGNGHLYAHALQGCACFSSVDDSSSNAFAHSDIHERSTISTSTSSEASKNYKIEIAENEVEEDEVFTAKKYVASSSYLTAILFAIVVGFLFTSFKKREAFFQRFSYITSYHWYILFKVFRI